MPFIFVFWTALITTLRYFQPQILTLHFLSFDVNRFHTTKKPDGWVSLDEYISRMKDDQDTILYLSGDSSDAIMRSPILQKYVDRGYEVLILDDPIDEFTT